LAANERGNDEAPFGLALGFNHGPANIHAVHAVFGSRSTAIK
jgi:hypothetical protein